MHKTCGGLKTNAVGVTPLSSTPFPGFPGAASIRPRRCQRSHWAHYVAVPLRHCRTLSAPCHGDEPGSKCRSPRQPGSQVGAAEFSFGKESQGDQQETASTAVGAKGTHRTGRTRRPGPGVHLRRHRPAAFCSPGNRASRITVHQLREHAAP